MKKKVRVVVSFAVMLLLSLGVTLTVNASSFTFSQLNPSPDSTLNPGTVTIRAHVSSSGRLDGNSARVIIDGVTYTANYAAQTRTSGTISYSLSVTQPGVYRRL